MKDLQKYNNISKCLASFMVCETSWGDSTASYGLIVMFCGHLLKSTVLSMTGPDEDVVVRGLSESLHLRWEGWGLLPNSQSEELVIINNRTGTHLHGVRQVMFDAQNSRMSSKNLSQRHTKGEVEIHVTAAKEAALSLDVVFSQQQLHSWVDILMFVSPAENLQPHFIEEIYRMELLSIDHNSLHLGLKKMT